MDAAKLQTLLDRKLAEHGLAALGWTGELDAAVRRFGACIPGQRQIKVSRNLAAINSPEETLDTILHEIAHALAFIEHGADCGHDARWQAIARRVGARPERTVDADEVTSVAGAYYLVHEETGEVFRSYHHRPRDRRLSSAWIPGRKAETEGMLTVVSARELALMQVGEAGRDGRTIRQFDRKNIADLREQLDAALAVVGARFGVTIERKGARFSPESCEVSYTIRVGDAHREDGDRAEFAMHARVFGLAAADFGRTFVTARGRFALVGIKPRNRRYPIIARDARGALFKFPVEVLKSLDARTADD